MEVPVYKNRGAVLVGFHLIDDEDSEYVLQFTWSYLNGYAVRYDWMRGYATVHLHVEIWERKEGRSVPKGFVVDHANRVRSDNRRENLRLVTYRQSVINRSKSPGTSSSYRGVSWSRRDGKWKANLRDVYGGLYDDEETAARVADQIMYALYGEHASLNFPDEV